uniref:Uncharacterized protein n=1 Tax=Glossina brevipalpis TaxID=37001 RepID=A0A1A9WJR1_9MUSC
MINGKFFTGLPPRMIDRHGTPTQNRLESHLYWPDETKVDSAIESKVKRRNSILSERGDERPQLKKQISTTDDDEVDVKERFQREFTKSSIQFYDNLNDDINIKNTRQLKKNYKSMKSEIAEKPTATKLEQLPESVVNEAYIAAKKQQAYTSKIQFYDYVNEPEPETEPKQQQMQRNNMRKPKMDMNDKRDVELNTKNSPKLQIKHNVRNFSEEKEKNSKIHNNNEKQQLNTSPSVMEQNSMEHKEDNLRKSFNNRPRYREDRLENHQQSNKMQYCPDERFNERRYPYQRRDPIYDRDYDYRGRLENKFQDYEQSIDQTYLDPRYERSNYQRDFLIPESRRVLRNNVYPLDYEDRIEERMNNMHLRSVARPRRFAATYQPEWDDRSYYANAVKGGGSFKPTNINYNNYNNNDMNTLNSSHKPKNSITINNKTNRNDNNNNKRNDVNQAPQAAQANTVINMKSSQSSDERRQSKERSTSRKNLKHLRSSLCFHDGEVIADNDVKESFTTRQTGVAANPTVNVGLPH